jgi:hypothetical protein
VREMTAIYPSSGCSNAYKGAMMARSNFPFTRQLLNLLSILLLLAMPLEAPAQPPPPDPIFRNGFEPPNQPPVADAGPNQPASVGIPVALDGSGSFDPDGDPLNYAWRVIARPDGSGAEVFDGDQPTSILIADRAGTYVIELVVSDGELFSAPSTASIIASGNLPSSAMIGPAGGAVGLPDGASVLVPPEALDSLVTIGITDITPPPGSVLPPTGVLAGGVYDLTPNGQVFQRPTQIVIPYDPDLLPPDYSEGAISIYRYTGLWPEFNMVGSDTGEEQPSSNGQVLDTDGQLTTVLSSTFSAYAAIGVRSSTQFTPVTLTSANARVVVRRPPSLRTDSPTHFNCRAPGGAYNNAQTSLATRPASQIAAIVIHSTNNGNVGRGFNDELGWGTDDCNQYFAHYYIDRDGSIYQVVDDLRTTSHTRPSTALGINNSNSIGIELFLNVGEPYDGRQVAALIRLLDFLSDSYTLTRPQRDAGTGAYRRNRTSITTGGDRFVAHVDVDPSKCDPAGSFLNSAQIREIRLVPGTGPVCALPYFLTVGSPNAPAPIDMVSDAIAVLDRDDQHTGIINTHGGDAFELGSAGAGGGVVLSEDAALVGTTVGTVERTRWEENEPALLGPGPLIVAPGATMNLTGPLREYTDVIVAGTLNITGDIELRLTGTFYLSPLGRIVARNGRDGADLTIYSRGVPIVQGLIDARGEDGVSGIPDGGRGGDVMFVYAAPGLLLVPTLYTRGGDADFANVTLPGGGPKGGDGGMVMISVDASHVFLGGGIGPVIGGASVPPWRSGTIDPALLNPPGRWAGDFLPPPPPFTRSSFGVDQPAAGERVRKWTNGSQPGFRRGLLTAGGSGGWGGQAPTGQRHGGAAGNGGAVQIVLAANGLLTIRDIDIATGAEIETLRYRYQFSTGDFKVVCPAAGALGGSSAGGGNGGAGGDAGEVALSGGTLQPAPAQFVPLYDILGFPMGTQMLVGDDGCSHGRIAVGNILEARAASGAPLYRLRRSLSGALLGGLGGIPGGLTGGGQAGMVGDYGTSAPVTGLPVP